MIVLPDPQSNKASLMVIEGGLTLITAAVAFGWPGLGAGFFKRIEKLFARLARRQNLAVTVVGFSAILLRLAILPVCPIPRPFVPNDFSFLLAADTFASGRLTNPTPAMWVHFETIHVTMNPTYMSMYFPAQGLVMAAARVVTGHPWYGVLLMSGLMCAAICWMLQAWLPPTWALLGGMLAVLHIGLFSYWINTYHAGGTIAALGGALVLGAMPRLRKAARLRYGLLMAVGVILLATTRPYEGLLLCPPVAVALGRWMFWGKKRPSPAGLLRLSAAPVTLILAAGAWMGYYNYRAFGNPLTLPYTVNRDTYAMAPYFVWQSPRPQPVYRHEVLRRFYQESELVDYQKIHTHFFRQSLLKVLAATLFFGGVALLPPLLMFRRVLMDRRTRFLVVCMAVMMAGMVVQIFFIPHYVAPFTAVFYALGLQAMRHLRHLSERRRPVGLSWVRLTVTLCVLLVALRLLAAPLHLSIPTSKWNLNWYGPDNVGTERAQVEAKLEQLPGRQLAIVRYSRNHDPFHEWVYNAPDIDRSKVIWAREMDAADNLELIHYYQGRQVWLVEADTQPPRISVYPIPEQRPLAASGTQLSISSVKPVTTALEP
ncbi:MAG: hypothetical protein WCC87_04715 [Candidatus Korobacteraceae bacterium]